MKIIAKGVNFTEIRYLRKDAFTETVQYWVLQKPRKKEECGVWADGKQIRTYDTMDKSFTVDRKTMTIKEAS